MAISSAVTLLTATACFFLAKNLKESDFLSDPADNANLTAQIMAELEEPNVADYRMLEALIEEQLEDASLATDSAAVAAAEVVVEQVKVKESSVTSEDVPVQKSSPDLVIEATHLLLNSGQHRSYALSVHFSPRPRLEAERSIPWTRCNLRMEWPLPRNVFVDVWTLRRLSGKSHLPGSGSTIVASPPVWQVKPRHPDIEAGAYDQSRAKPFLLTADVSFTELGPSPLVKDGRLLDADAPWNLELLVPDLVVRYQAAQVVDSFLAQLQSPQFYLPAPSLHFSCGRLDERSVRDLDVQWRLHRLRPIEVSLPVGSASPMVGQVTIGTVCTAAVLLISLLLKY